MPWKHVTLLLRDVLVTSQLSLLAGAPQPPSRLRRKVTGLFLCSSLGVTHPRVHGNKKQTFRESVAFSAYR